MALGYQNIFYLKKAQQKQQSLYNGKVLLEKHDPLAVYDSEETLQLAQESQADESLAKHKALELEIERLLRAVVSKYIMSIVQSNSVIDTSNLQTELDRTKERFENCIIKKENENAKLWNDCPKFSKTWVPQKVDEMNDLSNPVTLNSVPTPQESKVVKNDNVIAPGMFRINPSKTSREDKFMPINKVRASIRTNPIRVSQSHVITKKDVNSDSNGFSSTGVNITAKTRRPQPRSNTMNDRVPSESMSSCIKNKKVEVEEHHRNLLLSKNKKHMSSECNNVKPAIRNDKSEVVCAMCKQCLITANHDVCVLNYVNGMNSRGYPNLFMVSRLGLFQAYDWESKASHQFRLEVFRNYPLWK
ncbi:hypothetical protein Tco_0711934 [Tanacetum coccineum]